MKDLGPLSEDLTFDHVINVQVQMAGISVLVASIIVDPIYKLKE